MTTQTQTTRYSDATEKAIAAYDKAYAEIERTNLVHSQWPSLATERACRNARTNALRARRNLLATAEANKE